MTWGIIGALDAEVENIKSALSNKQEHVFGLLHYTSGTLNGASVVVSGCSIGPVNATACAQMMIASFDVDCIINSGIAGAMDKRLDIMDVVLSETAMLHDIQYDIYKSYSPFAVEFKGDEQLLSLAKEVIEQRGDTNCYIGRIGTGNEFVTGGDTKRAIAEKCNPMCVEMEGAAIAQTAYLNMVPFLIIRTMSDKADEDGQATYDNFFEVAAKKSAEIVLAMITNESQPNFGEKGDTQFTLKRNHEH